MPLLAISIGYLLKNDCFKSHKFSLFLGVLICLFGSLMVCVNKVFLLKEKADQTILKTTYSQLINGKSENWGLGASKKGDYLPAGCTTDYIFTRLNDKLIVETSVKVSELANYQTIYQLSFMIAKNSGGTTTLNIPYELIEDVAIYQITDDSTNESLQVTSSEQNGYLTLSFSPSKSMCKITLAYAENSALDNYLKQCAFEFIVEEGSAKVTNFVKTSTSNYSFNVEVDGSATIELPTLYYYGYEIKFTDNAGNISSLTPTKNENGFISITLDCSGSVSVEFIGSYVKKSNLITLFGVALTSILAMINFIIPKKYTLLITTND